MGSELCSNISGGPYTHSAELVLFVWKHDERPNRAPIASRHLTVHFLILKGNVLIVVEILKNVFIVNLS